MKRATVNLDSVFDDLDNENTTSNISNPDEVREENLKVLSLLEQVLFSDDDDNIGNEGEASQATTTLLPTTKAQQITGGNVTEETITATGSTVAPTEQQMTETQQKKAKVSHLPHNLRPKQPTFRDVTTGFFAKWRLEIDRRNSVLMTLAT